MADQEKVTPEQETVQDVKQTVPAEEAAKEQDVSESRENAPERTELEKLQDDYAALNDKYLRLLAEYDNFRKRSQREREGIYPEATATAVSGFLAVADNFERALAAECADAEYKKGSELTYRSLMDAFTKLKVEKFGDVGDAFDPNCHNAVMHIEDENAGAATVVEVFQKGYRLGDRIIRYAMVKVAN